MLTVQILQDSGAVDISPYTGKFTISDNIDSLGREFSFSFNNNKYRDTASNWITLQMGNTVVVYDNGELLFTGQIVHGTQNNMNEYSYKAYDNAFYLNKNQSQIQFREISVKQAIEELCRKEYIPCHIDCDIPTTVTKIYNGEIISNIIDDLLKIDTDANKVMYRKEYTDGTLYINSINNLTITYTAEPIISNFTIEQSIENMANKVIVVSSSEKNTTVQAVSLNQESIDTYGQYTYYEKIDDKSIAQASAIANNKLEELLQAEEKITMTLWGDNSVRSGRVLTFNQDIIKGNYLVTNCTHNYSGDMHTMEVELEKWHGNMN